MPSSGMKSSSQLPPHCEVATLTAHIPIPKESCSLFIFHSKFLAQKSSKLKYNYQRTTKKQFGNKNDLEREKRRTGDEVDLVNWEKEDGVDLLAEAEEKQVEEEEDDDEFLIADFTDVIEALLIILLHLEAIVKWSGKPEKEIDFSLFWLPYTVFWVF